MDRNTEHRIRTFKINQEIYRHVMNYSTDRVYLEHLDEYQEKWVKMIEYSPDCSVWDVREGRKPLGTLRLSGGTCTFKSFVGEVEVQEPQLNNPEIFLDTEVVVSKHYIKEWAQ